LPSTPPDCYFLFPATPPSVTSPLSLHDALPICFRCRARRQARAAGQAAARRRAGQDVEAGRGVRHLAGCRERGRQGRRALDDALDRKSTRLNSSHVSISYAVFCLKKKKKQKSTS